MTDSTHIQLITIATRENAAAAIESHLRDRGQPVRMQWLQPADDLETRLNDLWPDLIFCDGGNPKLRDYALHCCSKAAPDVPVLMLTKDIDAEAADTALQKRARDAVSINHMDHLQAVFLREIAAAKLESDLRETRSELKAMQARLASLVTVSQLAVANLQDGILVEASYDFCQLFGYDRPDQLNAQPFLELIHTEERSKIKKLINRCASGKSDGDEVETRGLTENDEEIPLQLRLARVETDDGNGVEIQVRRLDLAHPGPASLPVSSDKQPSEAVRTKPHEPDSEMNEEEMPALVSSIDEAETKRITAALASNNYRLRLLPFITLDGQQSSCNDTVFELQDEAGNWFTVSPSSLASQEALMQCDVSLFEESCTQLTQQLGNGQACTMLVPMLPAGLDNDLKLKELLETESKTALDGGQNLVVTLYEPIFAKNIERSKKFADQMRDIGIRIAIDQVRGNPQSIRLMEAVAPDFLCLDRAATQLLVSQGSEHPELAKIIHRSRDKGMHIVAFPLQDAHSMAILWQRGVNMVRGGDLHQAAA